MDYLKLFFKSEKQIDTLARIVYILNADIGMEFRIKKFRILTINRGKVVICERINPPNSQVTQEIKKEG